MFPGTPPIMEMAAGSESGSESVSESGLDFQLDTDTDSDTDPDQNGGLFSSKHDALPIHPFTDSPFHAL
jgi:hypothetical protein